MGLIQVLPPTLASQIAAGEVVDRPSSALKELLENALDAEATRCDVALAGGGVELLSVRDNGCGMSAEDVLSCVERHATSKLRRFEDLSAISSFGFRGEALPSIASVSRLTVRSRRADDAAGTEVTVVGGEVSEPRHVGMAPGTEIIVADLFYNVPARRKFLRSSGTEAGHLIDVAEAVALANPQTTIVVTRDGRKAREWLRVRSRHERVADILGDEEVARCYGELGPLTIEAFVGRPERAKAGANGLRLFCNTRSIRDRAILQSVAQAYGSVLERGRYPRGVVYLNIDQALVDVNVHPQKIEVRFADPRAVGDAVFEVIGKELQRAFALPASGPSRWSAASSFPSERHGGAAAGSGALSRRESGALVSPQSSSPQSSSSQPWVGGSSSNERPRQSLSDVGASLATTDLVVSLNEAPGGELVLPVSSSPPVSRPLPSVAVASVGRTHSRDANEQLFRERDSQSRPRVNVAVGDGNVPMDESGAETSAVVRRVSDSGEVSWGRLSFVAQVRNLFLVCEGEAGLFILDQHAAAERVAFDRLKRQLEDSRLASQVLLFPVTIELEPHHVEIVETQQANIARLGFEIRQRSERTASVHQVAKLLHKAEPGRVALDLLNELARHGRDFSKGLDLILATMACHGALRAGDAVTPEEGQALLRALDDVRFSGHCPHGRPIVTFTPWSELERKVGRR